VDKKKFLHNLWGGGLVRWCLLLRIDLSEAGWGVTGELPVVHGAMRGGTHLIKGIGWGQLIKIKCC